MTLVWCGIHQGWVPVIRTPDAVPPVRVASHRVKTVMGIWVPCPYSGVTIGRLDRLRELPPPATSHVNRGLT
jgi:hypothetical protein